MRKSRLFAVLTSGACLTMMLSLGPTATANASANIRHGGVLHVVMPWVTIPDNFNPLNPGQNGSTAGGTLSLLYEGLAYDNPYTGAISDLLATGWTWSNGGKTLTIDTRTGVDWSDGKPFSAADVAFTFNYIHKYPALDINGVWAAGLDVGDRGEGSQHRGAHVQDPQHRASARDREAADHPQAHLVEDRRPGHLPQPSPRRYRGVPAQVLRADLRKLREEPQLLAGRRAVRERRDVRSGQVRRYRRAVGAQR